MRVRFALPHPVVDRICNFGKIFSGSSLPLITLIAILLVVAAGSGCSPKTSPGQAAEPSTASATSLPSPTPIPSPTFTVTPSPTPTFIPSMAGVNAVYRSGQTFITWQERADLNGEIYEVYRSNQPIEAGNITQATLLAKVGKNSAEFYENRYNTISPGSDWKPRYTDRLVIQDGAGPLPVGTGLLVWTPSAQDLGGEQQGSGYYAVIVSLPGRQGSLDPRAVVGPISEKVADPRPVEITSPGGISIGAGGHAYIQYMDLHSWNPTFHAPNPINEYYGLDPKDPNLANALQYAYDYDVFPPWAPNCPGGQVPASVPVIFHLHGARPMNKSGEGDYPDKACAYGIYPFDQPNTWYFGFAKKNDYRLGSNPGAGDTIVNYTEQRLLRMLAALEANPPGPAVDGNRVFVAGQSMGGTGTLELAERYPNVFAAAYASQPVTNFRAKDANGGDWVSWVAPNWGSPELDLPVEIDAPMGWADPIKKYSGVGVWEWQDLLASASGKLAGRIADEMTPIGIVHGHRDRVVKWESQGEPVPAAFDAGLRAWGGMVTDDDHYWMFYLGSPPTIGSRGSDKYTTQPFWRLNVIKNETVPGLSKTSGDMGYTDKFPGEYNQTIMWSASWNQFAGPPTDEQALWQMAFCAVAPGSQKCGTGLLQTVDITPRRLQHFIVKPGATYRWENRGVKAYNLIDGGTVTADQYGLITVPNFQVSPEGNYLIIQPQV